MTDLTHLGILLGLDPGAEVTVLCALLALTAGALIAVGFALLRRAERPAHRVGGATTGPRELGLLALWRLERALRSGPGWPGRGAGRRTGRLRPSAGVERTG